jgi:hypothetical protein
MFLTAKRGARLRGLEFSIQIEDLTIPEVCPIFGIPLEKGINNRVAASPSIDRIDNTKGYVPGNVWIISWRANRLKCDATLEEMETLVHVWRARVET